MSLPSIQLPVSGIRLSSIPYPASGIRPPVSSIRYPLLLLLLLLLSPHPILADAPGPSDPDEIAEFLDTLIPAQLEEYQVPGAAVAVVKDGALIFSNGYGYADSDRRTPVSAEDTAFHIGSLTKLFTWTAVMQLVEAGKLDLQADVNTYLTDFQIPDTYPEPVTIENLLTHTPGFEDRYSNLFRLGIYEQLPLKEYLLRRLPKRVYPPGEFISYSNYGAALAGYIIEQVSGMSYEAYIEENLLAPLEMDHSSIRQPVPDAWADDVAMGHFYMPFGIMPIQEYFPSAPVVGMITPVTDMANFMIAHLQEGRYGDSRILQPETARLMHQQHFTNDARLPGVAYGFVEWERNGQHILWHGGKTMLFDNLMLLLPEHNVGVFISYNRAGESAIRHEFRQEFLDHYYPVSVPEPEPMAGYKERVSRFTGAYQESRWAYTTSDKLFYSMARSHRITENADGTLDLLGRRYVEVEPLVFREVGGQGTLIFHEDAQGRVTRAFYDFDPHESLLKLAWYESREFHLVVLSLCLALFIAASIRPPGHHCSRFPEAAVLARMFSALSLFFVPMGVVLIALDVLIVPFPDFSFLIPVASVALGVLFLGVVIYTALLWARDSWNLWERVYYTGVMLAGLAFTGWLDYWNLLGVWRF